VRKGEGAKEGVDKRECSKRELEAEGRDAVQIIKCKEGVTYQFGDQGRLRRNIAEFPERLEKGHNIGRNRRVCGWLGHVLSGKKGKSLSGGLLILQDEFQTFRGSKGLLGAWRSGAGVREGSIRV